MSIITLITDFGIDDEYVGLMKGVMLSIAPSIDPVDITHQIDPQDVVQAAYVVESSYSFFPEGTVHVVVVDPGVGGKRDIIALQVSQHVFVAPDNGVLTLLFEAESVEALIRVENSQYFLRSISTTFHGRDIIAPVAAHIASGVALSQIGTNIALRDIVQLHDLRSYRAGNGALVGKIVTIDHFGNLITNIDSKQLVEFNKGRAHNEPQIRIGKYTISGLNATYENAEFQTPLALIGSRGYLEIAVNTGSAEKYFKVKKGDEVIVEW
ncbi:MAG: SAM hydrolase/SAM-dependent halogenase family protein [Planctomycetota bacterium]|jgi:S-adenosylmethionine hydrolase